MCIVSGRNEKPVSQKILQIVCLLLGIGFLMLRFFDIDADFPVHLTSSHTLYTDEGWYNNGALTYMFSGLWLRPGEYHSIAYAPVIQLLQTINFSIFGVSLVTARSFSASFFLMMVLGGSFWLYRLRLKHAILPFIFLVSVHYVAFAYCRLALVDIPAAAFAFASFLTLAGAGPSSQTGFNAIFISALLFCAAVMSKLLVLFMLPVLWVVLLRQNGLNKPFLKKMVILNLIVIVVIACYYSYLKEFLTEDYEYIFTATQKHMRFSVEKYLSSVFNIFSTLSTHLGTLFVSIAVISTLFLYALPLKKNERDILIYCSLWVLGSSLQLALSSYSVPRYYVALVIPLGLLCALAFSVGLRLTGKSALSYGLIGLFGLYGLMQGEQLYQYTKDKSWEFKNLAINIDREIRQRPEAGPLLGAMADSLSFTRQVQGRDNILGTMPIAEKLVRFQPSYFVSLGRKGSTQTAIADQCGGMDVIGRWNAYGRHVLLFEIRGQCRKLSDAVN